MDCSTPGFPVLQHLPELAQTHAHQVSEPSNHLILCRPLLLLPSIFPSIRVFSSYKYEYILSVLSLPPTPSSHCARSSQSTELSSLCERTCGHWVGRGTWDKHEDSPDICALHAYREYVTGNCSSSGLDLIFRRWIHQPIKYKRNLTLHVPKFYVEII